MLNRKISLFEMGKYYYPKLYEKNLIRLNDKIKGMLLNKKYSTIVQNLKKKTNQDVIEKLEYLYLRFYNLKR